LCGHQAKLKAAVSECQEIIRCKWFREVVLLCWTLLQFSPRTSKQISF